MEFKGTKGKWKLNGQPFRNNANDFFIQCIASDSDNIMLPANAFGITEIDAKHNALIISKAPEMLEMLQQILKESEIDIIQGLDKLKVRKLINEATYLTTN